MKICFLTNELSFQHGWGRYSIGLIKELAKKNHQCLVLTDKIAKRNDLKEVENYSILSSRRNDLIKPFFIWQDYLKVRKITKDCQFVHSLIEPYAPLASLVAKKKPLFITAHGTYTTLLLSQPIIGQITKKSFKKAKQVFCVSQFTQKDILKKINLKNTLVINNGVDFDRWQTNEKIFSAKEKIILGVGALKPRKGYHISIEAMVEVKLKYPHLKYYVVGDQEDKKYFEQLKKLVQKLHLKNNVVFLEKISDQEMIKLYYQADLFLLTPVNIGHKFEGFGLVYLEAGACKKPVIGTYGCGAEEAIKKDFNGLLVPQKDVAKTTEAILKILDNQELAQALGLNGCQQALSMDWSNIIYKYIKAYNQSL